MRISLSIQESRMILSIRDRFDLTVHYEFFDYMEEGLADPTVRSVEVDLSEVTSIDSSGHGMLFVLQDKAKTAGKGKVTLKGAKGLVEKSLEISRLNQMFNIS